MRENKLNPDSAFLNEPVALSTQADSDDDDDDDGDCGEDYES